MRQPGRKRSQSHADGQQPMEIAIDPPRAKPRDQPGRIQRAQECADAPTGIQPSVAHGAGMEDVVAEGAVTTTPVIMAPRNSAQLTPRKIRLRSAAQKLQAFAHLAQEAFERGFRRDDIGAQLGWPRHHMPSLRTAK